MSINKILISVAVIGAVSALAIGGTIAYFTDTQTSTGNTFAAGTLDLKVDSTCHYDGMVCASSERGSTWQLEDQNSTPVYPELLGTSCACTWAEKDLNGDVFFNFNDVKPGDNGENTVSLHVVNNPAWVCAQISDLTPTAGTCNKPKCLADGGNWNGTQCDVDCTAQLQNKLLFTVWKDNGEGQGQACNNVLDEGEQILVDNQPATAGIWPIADSQTGAGPLAGDSNTCIGVKWSIDPLVGNEIQADSLTSTVTFTATQSRNNAGFVCAPRPD